MGKNHIYLNIRNDTMACPLHNESFLNEVISQMYVHWQWNDGNEILTARNEVFIEKNEQSSTDTTILLYEMTKVCSLTIKFLKWSHKPKLCSLCYFGNEIIS